MIVLDASAAVELLLRMPSGDRVMVHLLEGEATLHAPELHDIGVLHVLRRAIARGVMTARRAEQSIALLASLPCRRHGHSALRARCWQLRANLSAYDAVYVALAEALDGTLLTCDRHLANARTHAARSPAVEQSEPAEYGYV